MLPLIAASIASGAVRAGLGAVHANQVRQRNKGLIAQAYGVGQERLNTEQGDARQTAGEGLIARGLAGAGTVSDMGRVGAGGTTDVTQAHDLGGQAVLDQRREQGLAQTELRTQRDNALKDNDAQRTEGYIGAALGGVQTGIDTYTGLSSLGAMKGGGGGTVNPATPSMSGATQSGIPGWGGIDAVDPLGRGAWARPAAGAPSTGGFNVFSHGGTF